MHLEWTLNFIPVLQWMWSAQSGFPALDNPCFRNEIVDFMFGMTVWRLSTVSLPTKFYKTLPSVRKFLIQFVRKGTLESYTNRVGGYFVDLFVRISALLMIIERNCFDAKEDYNRSFRQFRYKEDSRDLTTTQEFLYPGLHSLSRRICASGGMLGEE